MNVRRRGSAKTGAPGPRPEGSKGSGPVKKDGRDNIGGGPRYEHEAKRDTAERIYRDYK
jgi:hypothetical protein